MSTQPVDSSPYAAALRDADPRLRSSEVRSLAAAEPSHVTAVREARFAAYRSRAEVRPPVTVPAAPAPPPDAATAQAWNDQADAYRARLREAPVAEPGAWTAAAAETSRAGAATAREALRQHRKAS